MLTTFEGKVKGRLRCEGDELRILNRVTRRTANGYEWEADQRHAEFLIASADLHQDTRSLASPGRKLTSREFCRLRCLIGVSSGNLTPRSRGGALDPRQNYRALWSSIVSAKLSWATLAPDLPIVSAVGGKIIIHLTHCIDLHCLLLVVAELRRRQCLQTCRSASRC